VGLAFREPNTKTLDLKLLVLPKVVDSHSLALYRDRLASCNRSYRIGCLAVSAKLTFSISSINRSRKDKTAIISHLGSFLHFREPARLK
jgi:hypothetical protein